MSNINLLINNKRSENISINFTHKNNKDRESNSISFKYSCII